MRRKSVSVFAHKIVIIWIFDVSMEKRSVVFRFNFHLLLNNSYLKPYWILRVSKVQTFERNGTERVFLPRGINPGVCYKFDRINVIAKFPLLAFRFHAFEISLTPNVISLCRSSAGHANLSSANLMGSLFNPLTFHLRRRHAQHLLILLLSGSRQQASVWHLRGQEEYISGDTEVKVAPTLVANENSTT